MIKKFKLFERSNVKMNDLFDKLNSDEKYTITIEDIIEVKDDMNNALSNGWSFLQMLINLEMDPELIKTAIDCGADINQKVYPPGGKTFHNNEYFYSEGMTPLILASIKGITYKNVKLLIEKGADLNVIDSNGNDFMFYLYNGEDWLKEYFPEKYLKYLKYKKANDFNL